MRELIKQGFLDALNAFFGGAWLSLKAWLVSASFSLALVGGVVCVLLYVAGWDKGLKWTGILFVVHVIIRVVLG